mmetsp:Transcript_4258/g.4940  ORF Transcript_4258/g.4940 Transcript_4258/m.4940 type:complete len:231 (+) Transcript_4258:231-923(+)|eukprot:CAMPEP_0184027090 /NCGR_PEP_ID=MMETSP0954-20121128/13974_1 /TAXON_ID=627963 /ORGANISM="Aplanochytrium sp, Strain PBS07" /LENGTH=230 /DNA_ID=CAMNT_0026311549 /DNA_START=180 /DNA_END=872 /DNA_ORIENTATION=+
MGASYSKKLEKTYLDLTLASRHMKRQHKKRTEDAKKSRKLVEEFMKKNEMEVAKIHAESAIRQKNEALKYLQLSARLDAVAQQVKTAISQNQLSQSMKKVVDGLGGVLKDMNVEKISKTMDQFETSFETLDVRTKFMDGAIASTTQTSTPQEDVTSLMNQVGEGIGIQVGAELDANGVPTKVIAAEEPAPVEEKQAVASGVASSEAPGGATKATSSLEERFAALQRKDNN